MAGNLSDQEQESLSPESLSPESLYPESLYPESLYPESSSPESRCYDQRRECYRCHKPIPEVPVLCQECQRSGNQPLEGDLEAKAGDRDASVQQTDQGGEGDGPAPEIPSRRRCDRPPAESERPPPVPVRPPPVPQRPPRFISLFAKNLTEAPPARRSAVTQNRGASRRATAQGPHSSEPVSVPRIPRSEPIAVRFVRRPRQTQIPSPTGSGDPLSLSLSPYSLMISAGASPTVLNAYIDSLSRAGDSKETNEASPETNETAPPVELNGVVFSISPPKDSETD